MKRLEISTSTDEGRRFQEEPSYSLARIFSRAFRARQNYVVSMTIWIMAVLLFALFGALGYAKGAIRMIFPLMGLVLGTFLAVPLGPLVKPLVPLVGLKNPIWKIGRASCRERV